MKTIVLLSSTCRWVFAIVRQKDQPESRQWRRDSMASDRGAVEFGLQVTESVWKCGDECGGSWG